MGRIDDGQPVTRDELKNDIKMGKITNSSEELTAAETVPFMDDGARLNFEDLPPVVLPDKGPF
jgi:hypothetical protein